MVKDLFIVGFGNLHQMKIFVFALILMVYLTIIIGNVFVICLIIISPKLHTPMYFFLCNLSTCEKKISSIIIPSILNTVWWNGGTMSLYGCITYFYVGASVASAECLFLTIMAYDRYLAICRPVRYSSIMNNKTCNYLAVWAWLYSFLEMLLSSISVYNLQFCGSNTIDFMYCDITPIVELSTTDPTAAKRHALLMATIVCILPFMLVMLSYLSIFWTIQKMSAKTGRQKAFSTCSSHLASVCTYFGSLFIIYFVPNQQKSLQIKKILVLIYTMGVPLLNPFIYSLRNQEMKVSFKIYFLPALIKQ
ncbi:olfactory receptor 10AG1-like [Pseudophryne corroboree]|uniref:olfactory receptor 10AG1-like n=1 Tax=Pseudophryne corroboree TaxID=495146 RepID=UPI0030817531